MSLDRPLALLLLVALPLIWWLQRRVRGPHEVLVSSVDALRDARVTQAAERPRRHLDAELIAWLVAAFALAAAASGPRIGTARDALYVVVDRSTSTRAAADGASLLEHAVDALVAVLPQPPPELLVVALDDPGQVARAPATRDALLSVARAPTAAVDGLPASLAPHVTRAAALGFPGLVLVTDRDVGVPPAVLRTGPGVEPDADAGVLVAALDGDHAVVSFLAHPSAELTIEASTSGGLTEWVVVPARRSTGMPSVRVAAPERAETLTVTIEPGGALVENDRLVVAREGGVRRVHWVGAAVPMLERLLAAAGIEIVRSGLEDADVEIVIAGGDVAAPGTLPRLVLGARDGDSARCRVIGQPRSIPSGRTSSSGVLGPAVPRPGVTVEVSGLLEWADTVHVEGELRGPDGPFAVAFEREIVTTARPAADGSAAWARDPAFGVFVLAALDHLAGGSERLSVRDGVEPAESLRGPIAGPATATAVVSRVRSAGDDPRSRPLGAGLSALGALAIVAGLLLARRRESRAV